MKTYNTNKEKLFDVLYDFIHTNDELLKKYVIHLKQLDGEPDWMDHHEEIQFLLSEVGHDDEYEEWLWEQNKKDGIK